MATTRSSKSSDSDDTSTETRSETSADTGFTAEQSEPTAGVTFTSEGAGPSASQRTQPQTATAADFPKSDQVQRGDWNPETHGEPPDARPASKF